VSYRVSICIPTCNRDVYLESLLRRLFAQLDGLTGEIEVVVSDNASDDRTAEIASAYAERPNFRYVRRSENGGAERNFLEAVQAATAEYCWLLGDDEILEPAAIERLLELVTGEAFDLALFSTTTQRWVDERVQFSSYRQYVDHFARVRPKTLRESTLISESVFRRQVWAGVPNKERFFPTHYLHTLTMAEGLIDRGRILVLPDALIAIPRHRAAFHDRRIEFEIAFLHLQLLLTLARMARSEALKQFCRAERPRALKGMTRHLLRVTKGYLRDAGLIAGTIIRTVMGHGWEQP
jgi:glycosyltransferase involved in cell wall biosynthesis